MVTLDPKITELLNRYYAAKLLHQGNVQDVTDALKAFVKSHPSCADSCNARRSEILAICPDRADINRRDFIASVHLEAIEMVLGIA